ncbi:MFS transporter [Paenibacillus sp. B01]|uniref:MFS transporter n=1 Tax=Paenibacillus sp. B01 TaxID=2660554 RepID=UPI00129B1BAB|nr:MFS transporter [Paenibacillus sp. B01]QGG57874.1 MFS transporter [Paenibacillus sp. B01]
MNPPASASPFLEPPERLVSYRLLVLLAVVVTAGASQGLLLPLLAILLERAGVPEDVNGLNSMALYIGTFSTMFFIERPVRRFGFKAVIVTGIVLITAATLLFPLTAGSLTAWFLLRLVIGVGDSGMHFATQLWMVSRAPASRRGTFISLYGMSYGVGFSIGPLGINLLHFGEAAPFLVSAGLYAVVLLLALGLPAKDRPEAAEPGEATGAARYLKVYRIAWYALLPAMLYGIMEASMNSSFPLYGTQIGLGREAISALLPALGLGGLLLQLPLGSLSDRIGRLPVLIGCGLGGGVLFACIPAAGDSVVLVAALLALAGGLVGSFFSLGLAYAADQLPRHLLPGANVLASIHFSVGSIAGPVVGGFGLRYGAAGSLFWLLGGAFLLFGMIGLALARLRPPAAAADAER